jgi:hypothetical protein
MKYGAAEVVFAPFCSGFLAVDAGSAPVDTPVSQELCTASVELGETKCLSCNNASPKLDKRIKKNIRKEFELGT